MGPPHGSSLAHFALAQAWFRKAKQRIHCSAGTLDRAEETFHFGRLLVYLDIPALDHHIERVPKMALNYSNNFAQRKLKLYGDEKRSLASTEMGLQGEATHQFYLISSLPHEITSAISGWALRNSVLLDGVYSLPYALLVSTILWSLVAPSDPLSRTGRCRLLNRP